MSEREPTCDPIPADEHSLSPSGQSGRSRSSSLGYRERGPRSHSGIWNPFSGLFNRNRIDFIWLIYSAFFWIGPIGRNEVRSWIIFGFAYAAFLGLYSVVVLSRNLRTRRAALVGLAALGYVYTPFLMGLEIYIAAFLPSVLEKTRTAVLTLIVVCVSMLAQGYFLHINTWAWSVCTFLALATGGTNILQGQQKRAAYELGMAHEQIEQLAKLAERERIARDLHDVLGHTLSVIVLKSELACKLFEKDAGRAKKEMSEVEQIARSSLSEVRQAIRGYRSDGLAAEIGRARATLEAAGVSLESMPKIPPLRPAEESVMSLLVREAVTNIIRHASASSCTIELRQNAWSTIITIEDDGRGGTHQEGNGLRGMRERVASLGGKFQVDSTRGTRLQIEIPLTEQQQRPS